MLFLAYIQLNILGFGTLTDDHAGIYLLAWPDEQRSAVLSGEQTIGNGFAGLKGDKRTGSTVGNLAAEWLISVKNRVDDAISLGVRHELSTITD